MRVRLRLCYTVRMQLFVGAKGVVQYDGKVLLVRESSTYTDGSEEGKWDMVGGRIQAEETLREGLIREVREECGLDIEPGKLLGAFDGFPVIRGETCHVVRVYFLCEAKSSEVTLSEDHDSYDWVDPDNIGDKVLMGDIADMLAAFKEETV